MTPEEGLDASNLSSHHGHHHHHHHHHLMDWLEDSISFLPTFLNEPYSVPEEVLPCDWWVQQQSMSLTAAAVPPIAIMAAKPEPLPETPRSEIPKKRKLAARQTAGELDEERKPQVNNGSRKVQGRGSLSNSGGGGGVGGGSKEVRWAEQLLNPLAAAIDAANLSRAQHLIYVLQELASPTGDANHRLAFYGLQALSRSFSSSSSSPLNYLSTEPRLFRSALIKFHDVSAWFAFPNCLANAAILQAAACGRAGAVRSGSLHVVDVGVSHGLQWPTLMEALARRGVGLVGQGMVQLTVVEIGSGGPFGSAPAGYDFGPQLMRYAKSIDLNLRVERGGMRRGVEKEIMVLCLQFRAGRVGFGFWKMMREMEPDLVVLTEMEEVEGGGGGGDKGFGKRAELLWRFLDSTNVAFKGRDSEERTVVEGEAAGLLEEEGDEGEGRGRERWRERMEGEGFKEEGFAEEAIEAGRALLKKYDGNWEMKVGADGAVGLSWKGQIVSFCSLWKPTYKVTTSVFGGRARRH
ncbi:nodulation-signaling pathway 1 protein-like [Phalaenopsis equestris]|uniref:nodulation-signaling pathway 1 protein-like n=1 Tax=Phalaenopsis equestris TaxID=78828 RepID=UPI0009E2ABEC|nr:nodulation-signaling pathway 1 protein-like [Phalaenopsis equestris]